MAQTGNAASRIANAGGSQMRRAWHEADRVEPRFLGEQTDHSNPEGIARIQINEQVGTFRPGVGKISTIGAIVQLIS